VKLGKYVVIEGHDGTGKSTQVSLIRQKLAEVNIQSIEFHEPAGSPIADAIRNVIKNGNLDRDAMTNLLLFSAARHDIWQKRAVSKLNNGVWVVASRNYYSTLAYQGFGEGLDLGLIESITRQSTDENYMNPDIALILDLDDETERTKRIGVRGNLRHPDTFESKSDAFQSKVRNAYLKIAKSRDIPVVSANQTITKMTNDLWSYIEPHIQKT
jgi:dTMP kinase